MLAARGIQGKTSVFLLLRLVSKRYNILVLKQSLKSKCTCLTNGCSDVSIFSIFQVDCGAVINASDEEDTAVRSKVNEYSPYHS